MSQIASPFRSQESQDRRGGWAATVSEERLLEAARRDEAGPVDLGDTGSGCPRFTVARRDGLLSVYEIGRVGDSLALRHRGEITKTARECRIEQGRVTLRYGFGGRVLLGPRGESGTVTMPFEVRVADRDRNVVATQTLEVAVSMDPQDPVDYFSAVREIAFDLPEGARPGSYTLSIAFDSTDPGAG